MIRKEIRINNIPSILWGEPSENLVIAVHGNMSHKEDDAITIVAKEALAKGYQVLSFDLPEHGERKEEAYSCNVQNCVQDLQSIMEYAHTLSQHISLFACSMGAYFSLVAYKNEPLEQVLFLSPVVNMLRIIQNMMKWTDVSEARLEAEKEIATPFGQTLYWDYYSYVKANPITNWAKPTSILYGLKDDLCEYDTIMEFVQRYNCDLKTLENGEHYFHTEKQLVCLKQWVQDNFQKNVE